MISAHNERSSVAYHEAGHVVVARALGRPVALVSIVAAQHYAGIVCPEVPRPDSVSKTTDEAIFDCADLCRRARALMPIGESRQPAASFIVEAIDQGIVKVAGPEAQHRLTGVFDEVLARADIAEAKSYASAIAVSPEVGRIYYRLFRAEARALVQRYWYAIVAVAERLEASGSLSGDEIDLIITRAEAERIVTEQKARRLAWMETVSRAKRFEAQLKSLNARD